MKRLINRLRKLLGADVKLNKWCIVQAIHAHPGGFMHAEELMAYAKKIYDEIT